MNRSRAIIIATPAIRSIIFLGILDLLKRWRIELDRDFLTSTEVDAVILATSQPLSDATVCSSNIRKHISTSI